MPLDTVRERATHVSRDAPTRETKVFAIACLEAKALRETSDAYFIKGTATTPRMDRVDDVVESQGAEFDKSRLPKLFLYHDSRLPIGQVVQANVSAKGITFEARIPKVDEEGVVRDRILEAVHSIQYGLLSFVSIGFNPIEWEQMKNGGYRFTKWEWIELSVVGIPANPDAVITGIKSLDNEIRAALGRQLSQQRANSHLPGASGKSKGNDMKTFEARLAELQQDRDAKALRGKELIDGCGGEYDKLEDAERKEYDDILEAVEGLDSEITRVRRTMKMIDGAVEVPNDAGRDPEAGRKARGHIQMGKGPDVPKGMGFTRYAIAMAVGKGSVSDAIQCAKDRWPNHPEVQTLIKANVGTTASGNWAENLATPQVLASEFIELVRPATILGRVANLRNVPFNRKVQVVTGGSTVAWVGQAAAKPVGEMTFDMITIPRTKVAGIIVLSDELIADATPDAEATVQQDLIAQTAQFLDEQAFDPAITVTSGIRPASLTNGAPVVPASGATAAALRTDLQALLANFSDVGLATGVFVMGSTAALAMSMMLNALGQPAFPGMNIGGGTLLGLPVIVSDNIPGDSTGTLIVLMKANEVFIAQDPAVRLDASREATLDLAGGNTPTFNLWQKNCVAIRAERAIHWLKRRSNAVAYISGASYSG